MMQPALPTLPLTLSFLQLNDYINCPRKFAHRWIKKDAVEKKSGAQFTGIDVHDVLKRRLKLGEPLPAEMAAHEPAVAQLLAEPSAVNYIELGLGCKSDGTACGFFDPDCVLRGRIDVCHARSPAALIVDWKTGKPWEDPLELKIQALLLRLHYPDLQTIRAGYYWLRESRMGKLYDVSDVQKTWDMIYRWCMGIKNQIEKNDWPPDENPLCPWCPVSKAQCEFKKDRPR